MSRGKSATLRSLTDDVREGLTLRPQTADGGPGLVALRPPHSRSLAGPVRPTLRGQCPGTQRDDSVCCEVIPRLADHLAPDGPGVSCLRWTVAHAPSSEQSADTQTRGFYEDSGPPGATV